MTLHSVNPEILQMLCPENLVMAYSQGLFPMVQDGELMWFSPDPRGLMPIDERFHISRSLERTIRSGRFVCTVNRCFDKVMQLCGQRPKEAGGTWISPEIRMAYNRLHELGLACSVEAWRVEDVGNNIRNSGDNNGKSTEPNAELNAEPVGGLYGVSLGGAFFAESMFHRETNAGKVALAWFIRRLGERGFLVCDVQWTTDNLKNFGAFDMPRDDYIALVTEAIKLDRTFVDSEESA